MRVDAYQRARRMGEYGAVFGCAPFQLGLERLKSLVKQAPIFSSSPTIAAAKDFIDSYSGLSLTVFYRDAECVTATKEVERHILAVSQVLNVPPPPANLVGEAKETEGKGGEIATTVKTVAIAAAVIAGAAILGPVVWSFFAGKTARRAVASFEPENDLEGF